MILKPGLLLYFSTIIVSILAESCNEFVCGSVVSKCLILQSCSCEFQDCSCCKDCLSCLGDLFSECCNCLNICPEHNTTQYTSVPKSQIADFEGISELFDTLTLSDDDINMQWTTHRFTQNLLSPEYDDGMESHNMLQPSPPSSSSNLKSFSNCTVIYLKKCVNNLKCNEYCESMGASSYRWFHDGCCECAGPGCINYGINESRCTNCPGNDSDEDEIENYNNEEFWDYGEDDDFGYE